MWCFGEVLDVDALAEVLAMGDGMVLKSYMRDAVHTKYLVSNNLFVATSVKSTMYTFLCSHNARYRKDELRVAYLMGYLVQHMREDMLTRVLLHRSCYR